jgi:hypothetical protein
MSWESPVMDDGTGEAHAWPESLTLAVGEPVWSPDASRFAALVSRLCRRRNTCFHERVSLINTVIIN